MFLRPIAKLRKPSNVGQPKSKTDNKTGKSDDDENTMEILIDHIIRPTSFVID
jgi:hypothetical protein